MSKSKFISVGPERGAILNAVDQVVTSKWKTVEEIQEQIDAPKDKVRRKLYYGRARGLFEYERVIRFRRRSQKKKTTH